ncbi:hypothetical protein BU14_0861s0008 [Porphyra umbilicalis]|uniref:RNase III domain-containing protein n=1 Tax=Porphyra umbilicalis TaxID=2786 RepID=A0A1X6NNY2_PORUM|nr:hypothetical protein BU14_0861s0008 [Porphyra umbilicalis]|eukprot:OSX70196.1 hypothetical protein BU14_0861s0008 [Porphyra umbilicalis]
MHVHGRYSSPRSTSRGGSASTAVAPRPPWSAASYSGAPTASPERRGVLDTVAPALAFPTPADADILRRFCDAWRVPPFGPHAWLLVRAVTQHGFSYSRERAAGVRAKSWSNEALSFVGDRVLNLALSTELQADVAPTSAPAGTGGGRREGAVPINAQLLLNRSTSNAECARRAHALGLHLLLRSAGGGTPRGRSPTRTRRSSGRCFWCTALTRRERSSRATPSRRRGRLTCGASPARRRSHPKGAVAAPLPPRRGEPPRPHGGGVRPRIGPPVVARGACRLGARRCACAAPPLRAAPRQRTGGGAAAPPRRSRSPHRRRRRDAANVAVCVGALPRRRRQWRRRCWRWRRRRRRCRGHPLGGVRPRLYTGRVL